MIYIQFVLSLVFATSFTSADRALTVQNLSHKWELEKYQVFSFSEDPADNERGDYIELKNDGTFASVSEGEFSEGNWTLDQEKRRISMAEDGEGTVLIIEKLIGNKLVLKFDDPSDEDAQYLEIHFNRAN